MWYMAFRSTSNYRYIECTGLCIACIKEIEFQKAHLLRSANSAEKTWIMTSTPPGFFAAEDNFLISLNVHWHQAFLAFLKKSTIIFMEKLLVYHTSSDSRRCRKRMKETSYANRRSESALKQQKSIICLLSFVIAVLSVRCIKDDQRTNRTITLLT